MFAFTKVLQLLETLPPPPTSFSCMDLSWTSVPPDLLWNPLPRVVRIPRKASRHFIPLHFRTQAFRTLGASNVDSDPDANPNHTPVPNPNPNPNHNPDPLKKRQITKKVRVRNAWHPTSLEMLPGLGNLNPPRVGAVQLGTKT